MHDVGDGREYAADDGEQEEAGNAALHALWLPFSSRSVTRRCSGASPGFWGALERSTAVPGSITSSWPEGSIPDAGGFFAIVCVSLSVPD